MVRYCWWHIKGYKQIISKWQWINQWTQVCWAMVPLVLYRIIRSRDASMKWETRRHSWFKVPFAKVSRWINWLLTMLPMRTPPKKRSFKWLASPSLINAYWATMVQSLLMGRLAQERLSLSKAKIKWQKLIDPNVVYYQDASSIFSLRYLRSRIAEWVVVNQLVSLKQGYSLS